MTNVYVAIAVVGHLQLDVDCRHFGFKKGSSCGHAIYSVRRVVDYYVNGGSTVNVQCESKKSSPPKTFCNIFTQVKYISVKFRQHVASLYLHIVTSFG